MLRTISRLAILAAVLALAVPAFAVDDDAVHTSKKDGIGTFLANEDGLTLYVFKNDSPGKSSCVDECIKKWPIFYEKKVKVTGSLAQGDFGTIVRADGRKQTTFRGWPLYMYIDDRKAGDTNGHGLNGVWVAADPDKVGK